MKTFRILSIAIITVIILSTLTSCTVDIGGFKVSPIPKVEDVRHNLEMLGIFEKGAGDEMQNETMGGQSSPGTNNSYGEVYDGIYTQEAVECDHYWSEADCKAASYCLDCGTPQPSTHDENDIQQLAYQCVGALSVQDADTNKWGGDLAVLIDMGYDADYDTVVTTYHSLLNAKAATFHLGTNSYKVSEILGYDVDLDLAILKIEKTDAVDLPRICYEFHENGQTVYVAEAMGKAVAQGELSDTRHIENGVVYVEYTKNSDYDFVGGALFNGHGEIIGINTVLDTSDSDYSYAISVMEIENVNTDSPVTFEELLERKSDSWTGTY